jgi:hypothetical protein
MGPYRTSLDVIQVKSPCEESWDRMEGDERVRFCWTCRKNVYDLSQMTMGEAQEIIQLFEGKLCVRLRKRADGTVVAKDCAQDRRLARLKRWAGRGGAVVATLAAGAGIVLAAEHATPAPPCRTRTVDRFYAEDARYESMSMGVIAVEAPNRSGSWTDPADLRPPPPEPHRTPQGSILEGLELSPASE